MVDGSSGHTELRAPARVTLRRVMVSVALMTLVLVTTAAGCDNYTAGNNANQVYPTSSTDRVVREIHLNFPGSYDITHVWASDNPNYLQWRMPGSDGSRPIGEGHPGQYCTSEATQTYSDKKGQAGGGNKSDTPDQLLTVPYCRQGIPLGG